MYACMHVYMYIHARTHTHTHTERERDRERDTQTHTHTHTHTHIKTAPYWLLWIVAIFDKDVQSALKRVGKVYNFDNSQSKEVLGFEYTDLAQTLVEMGESLIQQGYVPDNRDKRPK